VPFGRSGAAELQRWNATTTGFHSLDQVLKALEEDMLESNTRMDATQLEAFLAEVFVEFGSSVRVYDKHQTIDSLRPEPPVRRSLAEFKALPLAPGVVLTTDRATARFGSQSPLL
jgi:hypothetical protein